MRELNEEAKTFEVSQLESEKAEIKGIKKLQLKWVSRAAGRTGEQWSALKHHERLAVA